MSIEWDAELYAQNTAHHRAYDDHVLAPLQLASSAQVLDLGSGAGDFSARIAALVPDGAVLGLDRSAPLVARHGGSSPGRQPRLCHPSAEDVGSLGACALPNGGTIGPPFDLVVSTATLHWVPEADHQRVYRGVRKVLGPGGVFRAEFGGFGQITATVAVLNEESARYGGPVTPWYFPRAEAVAEVLGGVGFSLDAGFVRLVTQLRSLPDRAALRGWLDSQVLIAYRPGLSPDDYATFCRRCVERLEHEALRADGSYDQQYVRLDLLAAVPRDVLATN